MCCKRALCPAVLPAVLVLYRRNGVVLPGLQHPCMSKNCVRRAAVGVVVVVVVVVVMMVVVVVVVAVVVVVGAGAGGEVVDYYCCCCYYYYYYYHHPSWELGADIETLAFPVVGAFAVFCRLPAFFLPFCLHFNSFLRF